jgi:hypothetical protein
MSIDERINELHVRMDRAEEACSEGEAVHWRDEIHRLEDLRDSAPWCEHRRQLTKDLNYCVYGGDTDGAAVVQAAIDRWERGQP